MKRLCFMLWLSAVLMVSAFAGAQAEGHMHSDVLPGGNTLAWNEEKLDTVKAELAGRGIQYLMQMGSSIAGIDASQVPLQFVVFDFSGNDLVSLPVESLTGERYEFCGMAACTRKDEDGWFLLFSLNELSDEPMIGLYFLTREAECRWSTVFIQPAQWGWTGLASAGDEGVFLIHVNADNFRKSVIRFFSDQGRIQWKKKLSVDGLVFSPHLAQPSGRNMIVYGTVVSVSKGIYEAVEVEMSPEGDCLSVDARDFSFHPDPSADIRLDPISQTVYLFSREPGNGTDETGKMSVPVRDLELCNLPILRFENKDQSIL